MPKFLPFKNWRTVSESSSVEMQTNSIDFPASRGSRASLSIDGISRTHGPHQVAQKLRKIGLPLNLENDTGWSSRSSTVQSYAAGWLIPEFSSRRGPAGAKNVK